MILNLEDEIEELRRSINITDIRFKRRYVQTPDGETRARDLVTWRKAGDAMGTTCDQWVDRIKPTRKRPHGSLEWAVIGPAYEAWLHGQSAPVEGTPLEVWNGLSSDEVDLLRTRLHVHTVEQFAKLNDTAIRQSPIPQTRERIERAKRFLEAQENTAHIQKAMSERDAKIHELEEKLRALTEDVQPDMPQEPAKRGPGRPRKNPEAA